MNTPDPADRRDPSAEENGTAEHAGAEQNGTAEHAGAAEQAGAGEQTGAGAPEHSTTSAAVFTRRRGGPTLTFWIMLCLAVPAVAALVIAPLLGVTELTALLTVTLVAVLAIGFPLAGLLALIDAIVHRTRR